ncbi:MAG: DUF779 domain-containing protein [Pseudopedobacter saltans]|uniref:DUF779 domain-containing protein n=1 Tax=Pseudopedobacter saltans TaxID=151895 RepID=A0A2W5H0R0_9SPHI|nr:MAG: DUF779 domain-containing protein [Pseudopedobacter saltans]
MIPRVKLTDKAAEVVQTLIKEHGPLLFFQSGGCCEGSQPLLYPIDDFRPGSRDVLLGYVEGCPYYMSAIEFKYWQYTQLLIDVVGGVGVGGFSLESTIGYTFVTKSRLFSEEELKDVETVEAEA